jgi:hypothetical protein
MGACLFLFLFFIETFSGIARILTHFGFQRDLDSDPITSGRQFILQSRDGHAIWVSRRTLEDNAASIPQGSVEGGIVFRDALGMPTGMCAYDPS